MQQKCYLSLAVLAAALALFAGLAQRADAQATPVVPGPQAPTNVVAYPQDKAVFLTWTAVPDAAVVGYNIYARTADQTADKAVKVNANAVTTTFGTDTGLTDGTAYAFFVKAIYKDSAGKLSEGPPSADVAVTPSAAILGAFAPYTIDTPNAGGVSVDSSNVLTIRASGHDIWDGFDGQTFLAAPVAGDFSITAKLLARPAAEGTNTVPNNANVGLEIRSGLQVHAQYALIKAHVMRDPEFLMEGRIQLGNNFSNSMGAPTSAAATFPVVFRLTRKGTMITASFSEDNGATFTPLGTQDMGTLPPVVWAGIHAVGQTDTPIFLDGKFDLTTLKITAPQ